jgi:hypothetical protein
MLQLCEQDKEQVLRAIKAGHIDAADLSFPNLIDTIVLTMNRKGVLSPLADFLEDKRSDNKHFPFDILLVLAITAKMKLKTSLTDIPFAVSDAELLSELGFTLWDTDRDLSQGLFSESVMRKLVKKYTSEELVGFYNDYVQKGLFPAMNLCPQIHILDCTKIPVNLNNSHYENSTVVKIDGEAIRGYKLGVLRGVLDDAGVAEEIVFGELKTHDLELCRKMLLNSTCFKENDILINDMGFLSRDIINTLKLEKRVDTYLPAKKNMTIYEDAVSLAISLKQWKKHPNKKRKTQEIQLVTHLGNLWQSDDEKRDVEINACVVHDKKDNEYYVFMTTDLSKTAKQIIEVYEMRPEIEEDFRQLKDFWKLTDFKSTKYSYITFHVIMTLLGYLYFQIYKNIEEGQAYVGKSLPVVIKNYKETKEKSVVVYVEQYYGIFPFLEFIQLYAECTLEVRQLLDPILGKV